MTDLAAVSGYYRVEGRRSILSKAASLEYNEGARYVFARILAHVDFPEDDLRALEEAARVEAREVALSKEDSYG